MNLQDRIKKLRKDKGLTQDELGEKVGLSCRVISAFERGESKPSIENIIALSEFFNVSADYLLTGKEEAATISNAEQEVIELYRKDGQMREILNAAITVKKKALNYLVSNQPFYQQAA